MTEENSPLRAVINGRLIGVPEDFYDFIIKKELPRDKMVHISFVIGTILGKYRLGVGDYWFAKRLNRMIENGEVQMVEKAEDYYSSTITVKSI